MDNNVERNSCGHLMCTMEGRNGLSPIGVYLVYTISWLANFRCNKSFMVVVKRDRHAGDVSNLL